MIRRGDVLQLPHFVLVHFNFFGYGFEGSELRLRRLLRSGVLQMYPIIDGVSIIGHKSWSLIMALIMAVICIII